MARHNRGGVNGMVNAVKAVGQASHSVVWLSRSNDRLHQHRGVRAVEFSVPAIHNVRVISR